MGQLVLLVVAAAWAAVLVPPLLRSRIENRPNSSVSDFRDQLSSLQRAMPSRGVAMRSMGRPLAPVAAQPPGGRRSARAAQRRPHPQRRGVGPAQRSRPVAAAAPSRCAPTTPRRGPAATPTGRPVRPQRPRRAQAAPGQRAVRPGPDGRLHALPRRHHPGPGDGRGSPMIAFVALLGYVCLLGQLRQRDSAPAAEPASPRPQPVARAGRPPPGRDPRGTGAALRRRPSAPGTTGTRGPVRPLVARRLRRRRAAGRTAGLTPAPPGTLARRRGAVAQLVERNNRTVEARGSIPLSSTRTSRPSRPDGEGSVACWGRSHPSGGWR